MNKILLTTAFILGLWFTSKAQNDTAQVYEFKLGTIGSNGGAGTYRRMNYNRWQNLAGGMGFLGNVGIGTVTPGAKLDVVGDVQFTGGVNMYTADQSNNTLQYSQYGQGLSIVQTANNSAPSSFTIGLGNAFYAGNGIGNFLLYNSGRILIGSNQPFAPLHDITLRGTLRLMTGNEAAGRFLISDASGGATWQTFGVIETGTNGTDKYYHIVVAGVNYWLPAFTSKP